MDGGTRAVGALEHLALRHAPDALAIIDAEGTLRWASATATTLLGFDVEAELGRSMLDKVHPDDLGYAVGALAESVRKDGAHLPTHLRIAHADGRWIDVELTASTPGPEETGGDALVVVALRPLDERHVLPGRRRDFEALGQRIGLRCAGATWQAAPGIVSDALAELGELLHAERCLLALADHARAVLRLHDEWHRPDATAATAFVPEVPLADLGDLWGADDDDFVIVPSVDRLAGSSAALLESLGVRAALSVPVRPDGILLGALQVHWAADAAPFWDDALGSAAQGTARVLVATVQRASGEAAVHHRSLHDPLTGLANRSQVVSALQRALRGVGAHDGTALALLFCDVDRFKGINDRHGHEVGDRTLIDLAGRIRSQVRSGDLVGRLGGDEFVVVCERIESDGVAEDLARRIRLAVTSRPPDGLGPDETLDMSIGVASTTESVDADELLRRADRRMYEQKSARRTRGDDAAGALRSA